MDRTLQIGISLLNFLWIAFFLQPDPFSVAVWRRSSESSDEFCIQPPTAMMWTTTAHSVDTTSAPPSEITQQSITIISISSSNMRDLDETMTADSPVLNPTSSEMVSDTNSAAADARVKQKSDHRYGNSANGPDNCCFKFYPRRINKNLISSYKHTDHRCPNPAVILITKRSPNVCVDSSLTWVQDIMKTLDRNPF